MSLSISSSQLNLNFIESLWAKKVSKTSKQAVTEQPAAAYPLPSQEDFLGDLREVFLAYQILGISNQATDQIAGTDYANIPDADYAIYSEVLNAALGGTCPQKRRPDFLSILRNTIHGLAKPTNKDRDHDGSKDSLPNTIRQTLGFIANDPSWVDSLTVEKVDQALAAVETISGFNATQKDDFRRILNAIRIYIQVYQLVKSSNSDLDRAMGLDFYHLTDYVYFNGYDKAKLDVVGQSCPVRRPQYTEIIRRTLVEVARNLSAENQAAIGFTAEIAAAAQATDDASKTIVNNWIASLEQYFAPRAQTTAPELVPGEETEITITGINTHFLTEGTTVEFVVYDSPTGGPIIIPSNMVTGFEVVSPTEIKVKIKVPTEAELEAMGSDLLALSTLTLRIRTNKEKVQLSANSPEEPMDGVLLVSGAVGEEAVSVELKVKQGGGCEEPLPPVTETEIDEAVADVRATEVADNPGWGYDYLDFMQGHHLTLNFGGQFGLRLTPGLDPEVAGLPGSNEDGGLLMGGGLDASFGWHPEVGHNYKLNLGIEGHGAGLGFGPPNYGLLSAAGTFSGAGIFRSGIPEFNLRFGYQHLWNGTPTPYAPEGDAGFFSGSLTEFFGSKSPVGIMAGFNANWSFGGTDYPWRLLQAPAALKLRFPNLDIALGYMYSQYNQDESLYDGTNGMGSLTSHGMFLQALLETDQTAGNWALFGELNGLGGSLPLSGNVALQFTYPYEDWLFGAGVEYAHEYLLGPTSDHVLASLLVEKLRVGGSPFSIFGRLGAGWQSINMPEGAAEPYQHGALVNLGFGFRWVGSSSTTSEIHDLAPVATPALSQQSDDILGLPASWSSIFAEPNIAHLFGMDQAEINNAIAARYLLAFKLGLSEAGVAMLDDNYHLVPSALPNNLMQGFKSADASEYGYEPAAGTEVTIGSVGPVSFHIGSENATTGTATERDEYEEQVYVFEGREDKLHALRVAANRLWILEHETGVAVDKVQEATLLAGDLLGAIMVLAKDSATNQVTRSSVELFVEKVGKWQELQKYFVGTQEEFTERLLAELKGEVVGRAVWAVAEWLLSQASVDGQPFDASGLTELNNSMVQAIRVLAYNKAGYQTMEVPEICPPPAPAPAAPAPAPEPEPAPEPAPAPAQPTPPAAPTPAGNLVPAKASIPSSKEKNAKPEGKEKKLPYLPPLKIKKKQPKGPSIKR
jgi:hypothetical protein